MIKMSSLAAMVPGHTEGGVILRVAYRVEGAVDVIHYLEKLLQIPVVTGSETRKIHLVPFAWRSISPSSMRSSDRQ